MLGNCKCGNEPSCSIKRMGSLDELVNLCLLRKRYDPWRWLIGWLVGELVSLYECQAFYTVLIAFMIFVVRH